MVPSEEGQATSEGVTVALLEEDDTVELADELETLLEETDVAELDCDADDTVLELAVELAVDEALDETLSVKSLAPQIEELFPAAPRVFFK